MKLGFNSDVWMNQIQSFRHTKCTCTRSTRYGLHKCILSPLLPFYAYTTIVMGIQSIHFRNKRAVRMKASQLIRRINRQLLRHFGLIITVSLCVTLVSQTPYGNVMCAGIPGMILIRWWSIDICTPNQCIRKVDVNVWMYNLAHIKLCLHLFGCSAVAYPFS